jgi:hypothetical protein
MKKFLITSSLFMLVSGVANAYQFQAQCSFNQFQGQCSVFNYTNFAVRCNLQAQGRTFYGYNANAYESVILYPGQNAYVYVYANNGYMDPLVYVAGYANCM